MKKQQAMFLVKLMKFDFMLNNNCKKAQVSLEYLLILIAFFAALALMIPIISFSIDQLFISIDSINSKKIIEIIKENDNLFEFLSDGSLKKFEFIPSNKINVNIKNNKIMIFTSSKSFDLIVKNNQKEIVKEFTNKFYLEIKKENGITLIDFYE